MSKYLKKCLFILTIVTLLLPCFPTQIIYAGFDPWSLNDISTAAFHIEPRGARNINYIDVRLGPGGTRYTFEAVANSGYTFSHWKVITPSLPC